MKNSIFEKQIFEFFKKSELVFYTTVQEDIAQCRKKTAKRINKADACIKLANNNPLISGQELILTPE